jgi:primosomal protein N' (replication factor Y)
MTIAKVALDVPLNTLFDYTAEGVGRDYIGARVVVPFGRRHQVGVIVGLADHSEHPAAKLKAITRILDDASPLLSQQMLALFSFCNSYYHHPLGEIILAALPAALRKTVAPKQKIARYQITEEGLAISIDTLPTRATLKRKLLTELKNGALSAQELAALAPGYRAVLREFLQLGWASTAHAATPTPPARAKTVPSPHALTEEQALAVQTLQGQSGHFQVSLLHGITGSGKTEVYLQTIAPLVAAGQQVLVLVPEINLTPQLEQIFRSRFPGTALATLHSGLNDTERAAHWQQAQQGAAQIVLGTRLAVFTPMPALAIIIVDEEHDASFKQQEGFRYSARDVAIARAKLADIPVLLGSATPALESYYNALKGRYQLLTLSRRAVDSAALPEIKLIDTRRYKLAEGQSAPLVQAIQTRLQRGEQSLVFINRRGFAPVLTCGECGWASGCPRCSSRLVLHLRERKLRCHHCGHETAVPVHCPDCGNQDLKAVGHGTQRVEDALTRMFPAARILRFDRDSTRRKNALEGMLGEVRDGSVDILVGTQMLAKGHDFPNITLVCVLNADGALYSADFRASERLFAQLVQVAGRAGRASIPGEVLIQTQFPEHPLFQNLLSHDYAAYAQILLTERKQAGFPPFAHLTLLRAEATVLSAAMEFLERARRAAEPLAADITLYDPVAAPMARLAGKERAQLLVQSASRQKLQTFLGLWLTSLSTLAGGKVRWSIDIDPLDL